MLGGDRPHVTIEARARDCEHARVVRWPADDVHHWPGDLPQAASGSAVASSPSKGWERRPPNPNRFFDFIELLAAPAT